jgi:RHS repeat-associated protein
MLTAAKEGTFSASSDPCALFPLAAAEVCPKTRVWGSESENVHCSSATAPLRIELRWGCEESSEKTAVGSGVSFKYDPFGRRIYKSSSAGTSIFAYDGDNLVEETNSSGAAVARYTQTQNIDEPLAMLRSSTTSYYEADGLGSITSLSTSVGALAQSYTFDSFGKLTASSGSLTNPFQYTAREFDSETNLYFDRARYFDPQTGRFLSEDPIQFGAALYPRHGVIQREWRQGLRQQP